MEDMKKDLQENLGEGKFFNFDKMITPSIIKFIFIIGIALTTIGGIGSIILGLKSSFGGGAQVLGGLLMLILGPIFVRINCELMIVLFKIHEALEDIRRK